jgi:hypothetical protein
VALYACEPRRCDAELGGRALGWRQLWRWFRGPLGRRRADRGVDRLEPAGHAFSQQQAEADTTRMSAELKSIAGGGDDVRAKSFVLGGELRGVERGGGDGQRSFFSGSFR